MLHVKVLSWVNGLAEGERPGWTWMFTQTEFEPFDTRLASRCTSLVSEIDCLTASLAKSRRTAPAQAAAVFQRNLLAESAAFDASLAAQEEDVRRRAGEEARLDVAGLDGRNWDDVERHWERATSGLVGLKGGLAETTAKVERAKGVVDYMEGR